MKTIIAGSRTIDKIGYLHKALESIPWQITEVVSGGAKGADALGEHYARAAGIPLTVIRADWEQFGRKAGPIRNQKMAVASEALLALWDGRSRGTFDMIQRAYAEGLRIWIVCIDPD